MSTLFLFFLATTAVAQTKKTLIDVRGNCGMCKARIEKAALKTKGVKYAVWQTDTEQLTLFFNTQKTSVEQVAKNIAAVGHEANGIVATDSNYAALPVCCQYATGNPHKEPHADRERSQ